MVAEQIRGWQARQEEIARELGRQEGRKAKVVETEKAADEIRGLLNHLDRVGADSTHEELRQHVMSNITLRPAPSDSVGHQAPMGTIVPVRGTARRQ